MQFWALVQDAFRYSLDRKIFWVLLVISLLVALAMFCIGFDGDRVSLMFGLWSSETDVFNVLSTLGRTRVVGLLIHGVLDLFLGWIGVTLVLIATAGIFPAMMESGGIEVLLGKPISRPRLFLYKYLAAMVFVALQAVLFVVLTFLAMGFRWHVWAPGYLLCIPLMVLLFSYVFCISVLVGVHVRSAVVAILVSLVCWAAFAMIRQAPGFFDIFPEVQRHTRIHQAVRVLSWVPPKTADIPYLAARWAGAGTSVDAVPESAMQNAPYASREQMERSREWEERQLRMSALKSIGSSLLFEAVVVMLAMRKFTRTDF